MVLIFFDIELTNNKTKMEGEGGRKSHNEREGNECGGLD